jgi:hypothetical protein
MKAQQQANLTGVRLPADWTELIKRSNGAVGVIPWEITYFAANDLNWRPSPTLQTYSAYNEFLDGWSADHFSGSEAPKFLLASFIEIDDRHPLWGAPATWQAVLRNYSLARPPTPGLPLLLQRRNESRREHWREIGQAEVGLNEWIEVPQTNSLLFADIDMTMSLVGSLRKTAYMIPAVTITFELSDGRAGYYRMIPDTARSGLLISTAPSTTGDVAALFRGGSSGNRPVRIQISGPGAHFFKNRATIRWKELVADSSNEPSPSTSESTPPAVDVE